MSTYTTRGTKRKSQDDVCDISTGHSLVAPYEIFSSALGFCQFLVSGYLFNRQSFTSLYEESLKQGWDKIFLKEQEKLKKIRSNENSVMKCFLLNGLLHHYSKNPNIFMQKVKKLHEEIKLRMIYNFSSWNPEDLYREIQRWRDIQCRRRLFYFDYKSEDQMPALPSFLMLHKAMTNWCQHLIDICRQDKNYWNNSGRNDFIELLEHAFIIVGQPIGPDDIPAVEYTKDNPRSSTKVAELNVRIICLLNLDVLGDNIQLFNTGVTLCPLNGNDRNKEIRQTPIVWEKKLVMTADSGPISVHYTEVHHLMLNDSYSKRNNTSSDSNLYRLKFQTPVRVICKLADRNTPSFDHYNDLTSQPFGIVSHSIYFPLIAAKVFLYELNEIVGKKKQEIDPIILSEYIGRYHTRMLGVEPKPHTAKYIEELFREVFDDVRTKATKERLIPLIEDILVRLIRQIKLMIDYPVLAMMYDDSLFLGICNKVEVDSNLMGTIQQPQMLVRFQDLLCGKWNDTPEIRCIINNGTLEKTTFSKKALIDELCRFIYESADPTARQTTVFSYSGNLIFHNFQWYYNQAIPILSKIPPPGGCLYKPLIPVLWQSRTKAACNANVNLQSQPNNHPLSITYTGNQQDLQNSTTDITFNVKIPVAANIDPNIIVQYLHEKLRELCKIQDENIPQTHSIQSLQTTTCSFDSIDENIDEERYLPLYESDDDQNGPLQTPIFPTDSTMDFFDGDIPPPV